MARDKQLIVRLEESDREKFKEFCQENKLEMSSFLYELIRRFNDGSLSLDHILQSSDSGIGSEGIADIKKSLMDELSGMIAKIPKPEPVDIEGQVNEAVNQAIASLNEQVFGMMAEIEDLKKVIAGEVAPAETSMDNEDKPIDYFPDVEGEASPQNEGGLTNKELHESLDRLGIVINLRTVQNWGKEAGKTPPTTTPRGKEAIAVPAHILKEGKWYPMEETTNAND